MKILIAGYRNWALNAWKLLFNTKQQHDLNLVSTNPELLSLLKSNDDYDAVILVGWSWIIPSHLCKKHFIIGVHPSDLPHYAGGSPIQHQVIDGIEETMCSLFRITPKLDQGEVLHKVPLSLTGNMLDIFDNLSNATVDLVHKFIHNFNLPTHNVPSTKTEHVKVKIRKRLKPTDGELTVEKFSSMTAKELYNFIRCREDPYPNVYIEDHTGKLLLSQVKFEKSE